VAPDGTGSERADRRWTTGRSASGSAWRH